MNPETCTSSLTGPAGHHDHAGAPHVAQHAGTNRFKMALDSSLEAARNRTVRGSGAFGQVVYVRVLIPQGRSTGGNSPTTTMESGWGLKSLRLVSGSGQLAGSAGRISTTVGAPSVGANCQHSRIQVVSQAAWTLPSQGSDPSALELTSVSPNHTADQQEPTTPRRQPLASMVHTFKS